MGDITGFMKYERQDFKKEPVEQRKKHWREFVQYPGNEILKTQAARCMDCGIPFCHWACPVSNVIPDFNDLIYRDRWQEASEVLHSTNNFPEITGRVCPAPCENSCVLSIIQPAVTIKNIELSIAERAFKEGWILPCPYIKRTGKKVAVIGSGPAGLACADLLNKQGHTVTVYEKNEYIGGIMTFGIPDFKLEKDIVQRRVNIMEEEGVIFKTGAHIGVDIKAEYIRKKNNALVLCAGAEKPRNLEIPGRELKGVYYAMEYLTQQNRVNRGIKIPADKRIDVRGKNVIVLGGGDTGSDCVGTANRQGARSIKQFELLPEPPQERAEDNPWPQWANIKRLTSSHEEGVEQQYCVMTKELTGTNGRVEKLHAVRLTFGPKDFQTGRREMKEISQSDFVVECDFVFLAMGFVGSQSSGMLEELGVELDQRANVKTDFHYMTNVDGVFAAGDMRTGQSLVVRAIDEGRRVAASVDRWLSHNP